MSEPVRNLRDAEVRLGRLRQEWDSFKASNYDRKGLRLINNGRSVDIGDYVIRGEVNDLIIDALQNLDKFEIKQVFTNATGGTGLQNPLVESIRASLDSTYNIGEPALGNRIRWIFSDVTNSEILEVTDVATHLLHWQFLQDPATSNELDLKDPTNAILATFSTQAIESFQSIILGNDGAANIRPLQMRHPTTGVSSILTMDWATSNVALNSPEELLVLASYNPTPNLTGAVELYTRDDSTVIFRPSSLGGIPISNYFLGDLNVPWLEIYATQVSATFQTGLIPLVRWDDQSGGNNFAYFLGPIGGGATWIVELPNVGPNAGDVLADSGIISTGGAHRLVWTPAGGGGASLPVVDSTSIVEGSSDATKELRFEVDGFTSGAVRVMTPPNANATLAGINLAQTWTAAQTMQSILASADSTYDIGQSGASNRFRWGFADVWNAEMLEVENGSHSGHWSMVYETGVFRIKDPVGTVIAQLSDAASSFVGIFKQSLDPSINNTYTLGASTLVWSDLFVKMATLGKSSATRLQGILTICNTTNSTVSQLLGIAKDGIGTIEVNGSLSIGSSSNFYGRTFSGGDANCVGVDDGWMGFRTDTSELQICVGGTMVKVVLA